MKKIVKKSNGFTLTELAIVIAVIAVLIAVLVPTFVSLINGANESADEQNVKNMNTALSAEEVNGEPECLCEVWQILENAGYNPTPTPLSSANEFYWYITANRIVIVSDGAITYPSNYTSVAYTDDETVFMKLDTDTNTASVHSYDYSLGYCTICGEKTAATAVSTADDFATQVAATGNVALTGDITLTGNVDLIKNDEFNEVTIDLNGYTLTVERKSGTVGFNITYDSAADSPTSITITNGAICNYTNNLSAVTVQNASSVTFTNVTFIGSDKTFFPNLVRLFATDNSTVYNYTFKSCNFINSYVKIDSDTNSKYGINTTFTNCNFISTFVGNGNKCVEFGYYIYGTIGFNNCSFDLNTSYNNTVAIFFNQTNTTISGYKITMTLNNVTYNGTSGNGYTPKLIQVNTQFKNSDCYELIETGTNSYKNDGVAVDWYGKELN